MADKKGTAGVAYRKAEAGYFEKRGFRRFAGVWSLWALGVGAMGPVARIVTAIAAVLLLFLDPATITAGLVCLFGAVALTIIDKRRRT